MSLKGWAKTVLFKKLFSFLKMSNSLKAWPAAAANTLAKIIYETYLFH